MERRAISPVFVNDYSIIFNRRQSVKESEMRAIHIVIDIKAKDKVDCNHVDDFRWCKTIDLLWEDMLQTIHVIRVLAFHLCTCEQSSYDFGRVQPWLHVQIDERLWVVIKASWILLFEQVAHLTHDIDSLPTVCSGLQSWVRRAFLFSGIFNEADTT